jgi:oxygen-independent coproporphyrinogen-3 oxidase
MSAEWPKRAVRDFLVGERGKFVFEPCAAVPLSGLSGTNLYIHIPFCKSLCPYCPYNRVLYDKALAARYARALHREIELYSDLLGNIEIGSVYIGGGTPTTMTEALGPVLDHLQRCFRLTGPIALETIPTDLDQRTLLQLRAIGVSLLSIGVQSFNDQYLKLIGRRYQASLLPEAIGRALAAGFDSVNIDLMFALPGQTTAEAVADLEIALGLGAGQVTLYPLFTFPYAPVGRHLRLRRVAFPGLRVRREMYRALHDDALAHDMDRVSVWGFRKHEVARFSSVTRDDYIGIGAGAGTCRPRVFYFNTFSVPDYIRTCADGRLPVALQMQMSDAMQRLYWLYWRLYETSVSKTQFARLFAGDAGIRWLLWLALHLRLVFDDGDRYVLSERGSFWIHLLQNYYVLNYIDKVWTRSMQEAWPERIEL